MPRTKAYTSDMPPCFEWKYKWRCEGCGKVNEKYDGDWKHNVCKCGKVFNPQLQMGDITPKNE